MSKTIELNIPCTAEERLKAEAESIWGLIRRISARASDGRYYHFEEEDREQAIDFLKKFARTFEPAQGSHPCGEAISHIDVRLADLHEANGVFQSTTRDRSSEIQRNDREIRWLNDLRSILRLSPAVTSTMRASPISGSESCTCHFLGAGTHHIPGCVFYEAVSSFTSPESN